MIDLQITRKHIDEIDSKIVELFEQRMQEASEVAAYKIATGKPVFDKEREEDKLNRLEELSHSDFNKRAVRELFEQIMSISRKYQYSVLPQTEPVTDFEKIEKLPVNENTKVVYYGVEGTHTQQAMEEFFGENIISMNRPTFEGVMEKIENGEADYGVLPIENSSTGGISTNYDLLLNYNHAIVGEHIMKINQCMLALPGTDIKECKTVFSHPQGILQCSEFLSHYKNLTPVEYASTAECAKKVAKDGDKSQCAIASKRAAKAYGLEVVKDAIQSEKNNSTRFIIIAKNRVYTEASNKVALCIELPHESGSLYNILSHFIYNDLNLTQIESRPIQGKTWQYRFFIDVEGNLDSPAMKNALRGVQAEAKSMVVLGNFKTHF